MHCHRTLDIVYNLPIAASCMNIRRPKIQKPYKRGISELKKQLPIPTQNRSAMNYAPKRCRKPGYPGPHRSASSYISHHTAILPLTLLSFHAEPFRDHNRFEEAARVPYKCPHSPCTAPASFCVSFEHTHT